jgi:HSP20 family protein
MNQLTQWNPLKPLTRLDMPSGIEDIFRGLSLRPGWRELDVMPEIRIDVTEDEKSYKVSADMPGMKKEDINVSVEGRQVEISAETKHKIEKKTESCLYSERTEGRVFRSFTLPQEVESKKVVAKYDNGVLNLTLPKQANGKGSRIAVT